MSHFYKFPVFPKSSKPKKYTHSQSHSNHQLSHQFSLPGVFYFVWMFECLNVWVVWVVVKSSEWSWSLLLVASSSGRYEVGHNDAEGWRVGNYHETMLKPEDSTRVPFLGITASWDKCSFNLIGGYFTRLQFTRQMKWPRSVCLVLSLLVTCIVLSRTPITLPTTRALYKSHALTRPAQRTNNHVG